MMTATNTFLFKEPIIIMDAITNKFTENLFKPNFMINLKDHENNILYSVQQMFI